MSQRPSPPRGMRDLLPGEVAQRRQLLTAILDVFGRFGFEQIETPIVEEIERLTSSEGGENTTLVYKVLKRGIADWPPQTEADAVDLGLRYDLTVPLARFFASHSNELLLPFRSLQTGPVFRAERPQKGRYRQFTQCDVDILGEQSVLAEIELVTATSEALRACDVGAFTIRVNHRRVLESLVTNAGFPIEQLGSVLISLDKADKIGLEGVLRELENSDVGGTAAKKLITAVEQITVSSDWDATVNALDVFADPAALQDLQLIKEGVSASAPWIELELDATLVRGMGYYTGPIFEVQHNDFSGSIGGGGRYDKMIGKLSGSDAPAAGFSIGFERLCHILEDRPSVKQKEKKVGLLYTKEVALPDVAQVAAVLRESGDIVRTDVAVKNKKAQLERLTDAGFTHWAQINDASVPTLQQLSEE